MGKIVERRDRALRNGRGSWPGVDAGGTTGRRQETPTAHARGPCTADDLSRHSAGRQGHPCKPPPQVWKVNYQLRSMLTVTSHASPHSKTRHAINCQKLWPG